jgi:hypothetical protein
VQWGVTHVGRVVLEALFYTAGCTCHCDVWRIRGAGHEIHTEFWSGGLKGRDQLEYLRHSWEDNIRRDLDEIGWKGV